jgi:hypothetical protein
MQSEAGCPIVHSVAQHVRFDTVSAADCLFAGCLECSCLSSLLRPRSPATAASSEASAGFIYLSSPTKSSNRALTSMAAYGRAEKGAFLRCTLAKTAGQPACNKKCEQAQQLCALLACAKGVIAIGARDMRSRNSSHIAIACIKTNHMRVIQTPSLCSPPAIVIAQDRFVGVAYALSNLEC